MTVAGSQPGAYVSPEDRRFCLQKDEFTSSHNRKLSQKNRIEKIFPLSATILRPTYRVNPYAACRWHLQKV